MKRSTSSVVVLGEKTNFSKAVRRGITPRGTGGAAPVAKRGSNNVPIYNQTVATPQPPPVNSIYEYPEELNAVLEKEFAERNHLLADNCAKLQLANQYPTNAWEFIVSQRHNLVWCPVFKSASSIWLYYFNVLGGYNVEYLQRTKSPPLELARKKFPRPTQEELADALANSVSFLIVREPFERLVSAYRNKFEGSRNNYYKQLGDRIVKKFRIKTAGEKHTKGPTFEEFIRYIIDRAKECGVDKINEHWAPIYSFCSPCTINFTLIVKSETLQRDTEYIFRQALVESLFDKMPKNGRLRVISNRSSVDTKTVKFR